MPTTADKTTQATAKAVLDESSPDESFPDLTRIERQARLRWVPIQVMRVSPLAQRELNAAWVDAIAADFRLEDLGVPTVNYRGGFFYVVDGQHRVEALKAIGWGDQQLQCWTYAGLTEEEEAEKFLVLNNRLTVATFSQFKVAVQAGRPTESAINDIVQAEGLKISRDKNEGSIMAVAALRMVYEQGGAEDLAWTLRVIREAYGTPGFHAHVIRGIGLMYGRYRKQLTEDRAVKALAKAHGGVNGLLNRCEALRRAVGGSKQHCVAAAAVEIVNTGRGGNKLPNWFKTSDPTVVAYVNEVTG